MNKVTKAVHIVMPQDCNGYAKPRLFGGQLVSWIDEVAGACASRPTGLPVTTASIDNLTFKRGAYLADRLVLLGRMTYVGNTSCEVRVDTFIEDKEGYRHIINRAFLTYVAIDEAGRPLPARPARATDSDPFPTP